MEKPLVSICCLVYNHEPFLRECFEGFVMQKTTFPIEVLVHDDASTDHSVDIIREYTEKYPDIFKPYYQTENQYSKGKGFVGLQINFERAQGKYIAMCEGDDYWTDPLKLQKQVDFLEENEEFGLCYTDYDAKNEENNTYRESTFNKTGAFRPQNFEEHLLHKCYIAPMTWVIRRHVFLEIKDSHSFIDETYAIALDFFQQSKIAYLNETTAVYRIHTGSVTHTKNLNKDKERDLQLSDMQNYYIDKYTNNTNNQAYYFDATTLYKKLRQIDVQQYYDTLEKYYSVLAKYQSVLNSHAFRLGCFLLCPIHTIKSLLKNINKKKEVQS